MSRKSSYQKLKLKLAEREEVIQNLSSVVSEARHDISIVTGCKCEEFDTIRQAMSHKWTQVFWGLFTSLKTSSFSPEFKALKR